MNKLSDWEPFEGAIYVGDGCCRVVFTHKLFPDFVIKIPFCDDDDEPGFIANEREANLSNKYGDNPDLNGICYARAKLLDNGWLVMERVERLFLPKDQLPIWARYVDCQQIGKTKDGRIVAFDYE
jgi:hypothetical protein